jgi:hypothetical protein
MQPIVVAVLVMAFTFVASFYRKLHAARTVFIQMQKKGLVSNYVLAYGHPY